MKVKSIIINQKPSTNDFYTPVFTDRLNKTYIQENGKFVEKDLDEKNMVLVKSDRDFMSGKEIFAFIDDEENLIIGTVSELTPLLKITFYKKNVSPEVRLKIGKLLGLTSTQIKEIASQ